MRRTPDVREAIWAQRRPLPDDARPPVRNRDLLESVRGWLEARFRLPSWPWGKGARAARQQAAERAARARLLRETSHWRVAFIARQLWGGAGRTQGTFHTDHLRRSHGSRALRRAQGQRARHRPRLDGHRPFVLEGNVAHADVVMGRRIEATKRRIARDAQDQA
jgi:hypothetical protein